MIRPAAKLLLASLASFTVGEILECSYPSVPLREGTPLNDTFTCGSIAAGNGDSTLRVYGELPPLAAPSDYADTRSVVYSYGTASLNRRAVRVGLATSHEWNMLDLNETVEALISLGKQGVELVTLEEEHNLEFSRGIDTCADSPPGYCSLDGPWLAAVAAVAKQYSFYLVAPMRRIASDGITEYNSAVVIGRDGQILPAALTKETAYNKMFPVLGDMNGAGGEAGVTPGEVGVQVFDLAGIGRVAVLICFDINFSELWHAAEALGTDLVIWPTAMSTPDFDMRARAAAHRLAIVGCGHPGDVVGSDGMSLPQQRVGDCTAGWCTSLATVDLDAVWVHHDNNCELLAALLAANPALTQDHCGCAGFGLRCDETKSDIVDNCIMRVFSTDPHVSATALIGQSAIETRRQYILRSRQGLNTLRQRRRPLPPPPADRTTRTQRFLQGHPHTHPHTHTHS